MMSKASGLVFVLLVSLALGTLAQSVFPVSSTALLGEHNNARKRYGLTPQVWDATLASAAQSWSTRCKYAHSTVGGENLAAWGGVPSAVSAKMFIDEQAFWNCGTNKCAAGKVCGHYTQIIWASSTRLGCAAIICTTGSPFGASWPRWTFMTCRYSPVGNYIGQHPLGSAAKCSYVPPPPAAKWVNYNNGFQVMSYSGSNTVYLGGLSTTGTAAWSTNKIIRQVTSAIAPGGARVLMTVMNSHTYGRVDVTPVSGVTRIAYVSGGAGSQWVSLDSVFYPRAGLSALTLANGFVNYGTPYSTAAASLDAGGVYVCGLIKRSSFANLAIATLPSGRRPQYREIFPASVNNKWGRVDVANTGQIILVQASAGGTSGWISLSNIRFRPAGTAFSAIGLKSAWANYGGSYAPAGSSLGADGRVMLRGLIKSGTAATLGQLPSGHFPAAKRLFIALCNNGPCRVDVSTTGVISLVGRTPGTTNWPGWVSLSGIAFDPRPDANI